MKIPVDGAAIERGEETATTRLAEELYTFGKDATARGGGQLAQFEELDYAGKNKDFQFRQAVVERNAIVSRLSLFQCVRCPDLLEHVWHGGASIVDGDHSFISDAPRDIDSIVHINS